MNRKQFSIAENRVVRMSDLIQAKVAPRHYEALMSLVYTKAQALAEAAGMNPAAIEDLRRAEVVGTTYPSSLLYSLVPNLRSWGLFTHTNVEIMAGWVNVPVPAEPAFLDVRPAIEDLAKLTHYRPDRILASFPIMVDLFPGIAIPDDPDLVRCWRRISVVPSNLVAICTLAKTLGVEL